MAVTFGANSYFTVTDTGSTVRNLSGFLTDLDGLPGEVTMEDVTPFGASGQAKVYGPGMNDAKITMKGFWDPTATTGPDVVLEGLRSSNTLTAYVFGPQGSTTGNVKYSGSGYVSDFKITSTSEKYCTFSCTIQRSGPGVHGNF